MPPVQGRHTGSRSGSPAATRSPADCLGFSIPNGRNDVKKSLLLIAAAVLAVAVTSSIAVGAVNVKTLPTATFSGATVNPQGHASPGQNPVPANPGSSGPIDLGNADDNGRGTINGARRIGDDSTNSVTTGRLMRGYGGAPNGRSCLTA
jgi:hypothetical protein